MSTIYEFDEDFQLKLTALAVRDVDFNIRTAGLVEPSYLENNAHGTLINLVAQYYERYKTVPSLTVLAKLIKDAVADKTIREDMREDVKTELGKIMRADLSDRDYVIDEVSTFARHQAIHNAMIKSVNFLDRREFDSIEAEMSKAMQVAANDGSEGHDLFADIEARAEMRKEILAGTRKRAVTSGYREFDDATSDGGFSRGELSVLMGPAKMGKSFGLMNFAVNAMLAKYNVLFISLENSVEVTTNRIEAYLSGIQTKKLNDHIDEVAEKVRKKLTGKGTMKLHRYPTNSFSPRDMVRLMEQYRARGLLFDMVVIDYWDIMQPPVRYRDDKISESREIGVELRAIAMKEDVAMLTAVQTNREGYKATTARADHVAEDFNKVRLADLLFSINATDDEKAEGEARIYFAAVRNSEGSYERTVHQDLSRGIFISRFEPRGA